MPLYHRESLGLTEALRDPENPEEVEDENHFNEGESMGRVK